MNASGTKLLLLKLIYKLSLRIWTKRSGVAMRGVFKKKWGVADLLNNCSFECIFRYDRDKAIEFGKVCQMGSLLFEKNKYAYRQAYCLNDLVAYYT